MATKARQTRRKAEQVAEKSAALNRPKNPIQALVPHLVEQHDIVFLIGGAGTGKSWSAMNAVWSRIAAGKCDRVMLGRSATPCDGEELGFLKGDLNEKMEPWMGSFADVMVNIVGDRKKADAVLATFEKLPLGMIRGRNFLAGTCVVIDEVQNLSLAKLHAVLTRGCEHSKTILCGDPSQCDLPGGSPLVAVAHAMEQEGAAAVVTFSDDLIVRSPNIVKVNRAIAKVRSSLGKS